MWIMFFHKYYFVNTLLTRQNILILAILEVIIKVKDKTMSTQAEFNYLASEFNQNLPWFFLLNKLFVIIWSFESVHVFVVCVISLILSQQYKVLLFYLQCREGYTCLTETFSDRRDMTPSHDIPGQIYNPDEQCRMIWGPESYLCRVWKHFLYS